MTIQQLEYILAVERFRHFGKAAEHCLVTQPTLSVMVQKLEEELDVKIFDRSIQPVQPTSVGRKIIEQARAVFYWPMNKNYWPIITQPLVNNFYLFTNKYRDEFEEINFGL